MAMSVNRRIEPTLPTVMGQRDPEAMIRVRSTDPIRASGLVPRQQAGHVTASDRSCRNARKPLPAGGHPHMTVGTGGRCEASVSQTFGGFVQLRFMRCVAATEILLRDPCSSFLLLCENMSPCGRTGLAGEAQRTGSAAGFFYVPALDGGRLNAGQAGTIVDGGRMPAVENAESRVHAWNLLRFTSGI